jgi:hypothetical protein
MKVLAISLLLLICISAVEVTEEDGVVVLTQGNSCQLKSQKKISTNISLPSRSSWLSSTLHGVAIGIINFRPLYLAKQAICSRVLKGSRVTQVERRRLRASCES